MRAWLVLLAASVLATAGAACADDGYLPAGLVPDGVAILPSPTEAGSPAARADQAIFRATRRLRNSVRWRIATDDVTNSPLERYACALDLQLTPAAVPRLAHLLARVGTGTLVDPVKSHYKVRRPFVGTQEPLCEPRTEHLIANGDYPSGHAANGWLEALILASLLPEHATAVLVRGRAYGESRVVCGSHSASAVEGGWMAGSAMFAALMGQPEFRQDLESARQELSEISPGTARPDSARCLAERTALADGAW